ncbi:hypothetical protein [Kibdelosporangium aridum]|uniref:hypothetical protein n=1 Tax=Kibdelosporangium aridum TaxID=2030 RepID=UPI0007C4DED0|nr:hypothetical protein [Kibdelosporangium aridum]
MMTLVVVVVGVALFLTARRRRRRAWPLPKRGRRKAFLTVATILGLQLVVFAPTAVAQDCDNAPNPGRPTAGMVAALDAPRPSHGTPGSIYGQYAYAGQVWHVYDESCGALGKAITDPDATIGNWMGNQLFDVGKNFVAATNGVHYALAYDELMGPLDTAIDGATKLFYDNIYLKWFGLAAVILAVLLFRYIWRGDLATVSRRGLWALAAMWVATSFVIVGPLYKEVEERFLSKTTQIQAGFLADNAPEADLHALPEALHDKVVYQNWLRGEFGSEDAPEAKQFGQELLAAQAWTKFDSTDTVDQAALEAKKAKYKEIATKLGPTKGYFTGTDGSRTGAGFLALFQGIVYSLFQLFAKLGILLAQVLLRIFLLATPLIGLIAILYHDLLRKVARAGAAVVLNVLVLAALAGMHVLLLNAIFNAGDSLPTIAMMALAALITVIFFVIGRPVRRMWQMVELSVGAVGGAMPSAGPGLFGRFRRKGDQRTAQDEFWDNVREGDHDDEPVVRRDGRRPRPEATNPVAASAERMDRNTPRAGAGRTEIGASAAAVLGAGGTDDRGLPAARGPAGALPPAQSSRIVDTSPVADRGWDRGEDAVVVPSRVIAPRQRDDVTVYEPNPVVTPRPAETEMVAGRPVHVIYRPSRGFEVRDNTPPRRPLPMRDGPRETDAYIR